MSLTERMWDPNVDSGRHLCRNTCRAGSEKIALYSAPALSSSHLAALERAKIIFAQPRPIAAQVAGLHCLWRPSR